tara:strand:+ start:897 stop:1070 length:174 start_codon:yes stop_codon:yes gene_type:complete
LGVATYKSCDITFVAVNAALVLHHQLDGAIKAILPAEHPRHPFPKQSALKILQGNAN